jgi:insulysin
MRQGNYEVLTDKLEKASTDDRQYRAIRLENGLVLVLIHDPTAEKAAAALDVSVGHLNDPVR